MTVLGRPHYSSTWIVQQLLLDYPLLQQLTVTGGRDDGVLELLWLGDIDASLLDANPLQARLAAGFKLTCAHVALSGSSEEMDEALAWMPPLPSVTLCNVHLEGTSHGPFLRHLARVFPNLETLEMLDQQPEQVEPLGGSNAELFGPLTACTALTTLDVFVHVEFSTKGLFQLCQGLPALTKLKYVECRGVDNAVLKGALPLVDRDIQLYAYSHADFVISEEWQAGGNDEEEGAEA